MFPVAIMAICPCNTVEWLVNMGSCMYCCAYMLPYLVCIAMVKDVEHMSAVCSQMFTTVCVLAAMSVIVVCMHANSG